MAHVFAHDIGAGSRGAAQHDEQRNQFLVAEPQRHRAGQKYCRQPHGLDKGRRQRRPQLFDGLGPLKRGTDGQQRQRRSDGGNIVQRFGQHCGQRERQQRIDRAGHDTQ